MPREKIIRGDRVAECIRDSPRPFVTTSDIAEYLDVTAQGVRDNANELADHPELKKGKVAQSSVYWLAEQETPAQVTSTPATPPREPENDQSDGQKSVLDRLFTAFPSFGDSAEKWTLATLTMLLGVTLGVAAGIALTHPSLSVAATAVFGVLLLGVGFSGGWALYYTFAHNTKPEINGENA